MNVPAWRMSCLCADCPPSRSGCALPRPCTSRSLETALSSQMAAAAEGQFGKWHVRGRKDGPECRGGRGFGCLWQYRYHMLRVSPERPGWFGSGQLIDPRLQPKFCTVCTRVKQTLISRSSTGRKFCPDPPRSGTRRCP